MTTMTKATRRDDSRDQALGVQAALGLCHRTLDRLDARGYEQSQAIQEALEALATARAKVEEYIRVRNS